MEALAGVGQQGFDVHRGRSVPGDLGDLVCFAGRGPGEVFAGGRKVVGLSQWRSREGALFSSCAYLRWDPAPLLAVMDVDGDEARAELARDLAPIGDRAGRAGTAGGRSRRRAFVAAAIVARLQERRRRRARRRAAGSSFSSLFLLLLPLLLSSSLLSSLRVALCPSDRAGSRPRSGVGSAAPVAEDGLQEEGGRLPRGRFEVPWEVRARRGFQLCCSGPKWLCGGGKGFKVARSGVRGRQRTQARERRGRYSWWQAS